MPAALIAIDQGTTSTRTIAFDAALRPLATAQQELRQMYPASGEVEHDPEEIWSAVVDTVRKVMAQAGIGINNIAGIGIANQRETTVIWDRETGRPIHNAIVWQDRRTAGDCETLRRAGHEAEITRRTGLLLDPYFSATKIAWLLDHVEGARAAAEAGKLAFGTIDCFLLWRLTGGTTHLTDATNAARTLLFDIEKGRGTKIFAACFVYLCDCFRKCETVHVDLAKPRGICSVALSASSVLRVISRQPRWDRAVSPPE